ncbi:hypothetical protein C8F01DRAFT_1088626 [Mycena amicta]|nr:hypothetical protein C8F01DRAFT_1088626 [Mycena amicta]
MQNRPSRKFHVGGRAITRTQGDTSTKFSNDGRRTALKIVNPEPVKRAWTDALFKDAFGNWMPFADLPPEDLQTMAASITSEDQPLEDDEHDHKWKRDQYDPMGRWRTMIPAILDELTQHESLGIHFDHAICASCCASDGGLFHCIQCGPFLQCEACIRSQHEQLPLHIPQHEQLPLHIPQVLTQCEVWTGDFWDTCSLYKPTRSGGVGLGMPDFLEREMVVIDVGGIVKVTTRMCACTDNLRQRHGCVSQLLHNAWYPVTIDEPSMCATFRVLDLFRMLKVVGNMNAHDFVGSLEQLTDATFTEKVPDRYKAFGRMTRQYDFVVQAKRSGRGYVDDGIVTTPPGGLAVSCWACPDPARNLPDGWDKVAPENDGLSYFVEVDSYKEHLRHYVAEDDISTCIAFAVLMQKETCLTTGLRVSGVGGCVCARHGVVHPMGLGNLQKGERYANMDWVFLCAVGGSGVKRLVVSYNIACQWKQKIRIRATKIEGNAAIRTELSDYETHTRDELPSSKLVDTHTVGVGRTDGEGIERTRDRGGQPPRHDRRESDTLAWKLIIAIAERDRQIDEFAEVDKSMEPTLRREWEQRVELWNEDPSQPNPYIMKGKQAGPSEAQVLADLKKAELAELRQGRTSGAETTGKMSNAAFIKAALQLEDLQVFMPGVEDLRAEEEEQRNAELPPPAAENTKLWLPSDLSEAERAWACKSGLDEVEAKLREGQCADCLSKLRGHLHAKTHLIDTRNASTVEREATKYRKVVLALRRLKGPEHAPQYKDLFDTDLQVNVEAESDSRARAALGKLGSARRARNEPLVTKKMLPVSWIWFAGREGDQAELHDCKWFQRCVTYTLLSNAKAVRVQWTKTRARRDRWMEEVRLLQEQMRRVLRSLDAVEKEWETWTTVTRVVDGELGAGLRAYALRQAEVHRRVARSFRAKWSASKAEAVHEVLLPDTVTRDRAS